MVDRGMRINSDSKRVYMQWDYDDFLRQLVKRDDEALVKHIHMSFGNYYSSFGFDMAFVNAEMQATFAAAATGLMEDEMELIESSSAGSTSTTYA